MRGELCVRGLLHHTLTIMLECFCWSDCVICCSKMYCVYRVMCFYCLDIICHNNYSLHHPSSHPSINPSVHPSSNLSIHIPSTHPPIYPSISQPYLIHPSIIHPIIPPFYPFIYLSFHNYSTIQHHSIILAIHLPIHPSSIIIPSIITINQWINQSSSSSLKVFFCRFILIFLQEFDIIFCSF